MDLKKTDSFTLKEKTDFFKKKWLKEHIAIMLLLGCIIFAVLIVGVLLKKLSLVYVSVLLLVLAHCRRNNAMMAYVEKNVYDSFEK